MAAAIDVHAHVIVPELPGDAAPDEPWRPAVRGDAVEFGADRVLLGSDYPFDMADPDPVATVRTAALTSEAEQAVLAGNARRELKLGGDG